MLLSTKQILDIGQTNYGGKTQCLGYVFDIGNYLPAPSLIFSRPLRPSAASSGWKVSPRGMRGAYDAHFSRAVTWPTSPPARRAGVGKSASRGKNVEGGGVTLPEYSEKVIFRGWFLLAGYSLREVSEWKYLQRALNRMI